MFRRCKFALFFEFSNYSFISTYDRRVISVNNRKTAGRFDFLIFLQFASLNTDNFLPLLIYNCHRISLYQKITSKFLAAFEEVSMV